MDSEDEDFAIAACINVIVCIEVRRRQRQRRNRLIWTRPWILRRSEQGAYANLLRELREEDPRAVKNFLRMDINSFTELAHLVCPLITKQETRMRQPISAEERLAVTLRFLGSGNSYQDLEFLYRISRQALGTIIPETCTAIKDALVEQYVKCPTTTEAWLPIAEGFENRWNFPNCLGAVDGKHIKIKKPNCTGSTYYNYKGYFSIVLLAVVDHDYKFSYVDVGKNGRENDTGIFKSSTFNEALISNQLDIPVARKLPGSDVYSPYMFIGDDAFTLKNTMMRPYSVRNMTMEERIFNYRLSRARRIVENAFGILASRFRIFLQTIQLSPTITCEIVWAAICLHNFLRMKTSKYMPAGYVDYENLVTGNIQLGAWRQEGLRPLEPIASQGTNNYSTSAAEIRDNLRQYFSSAAGAVEWQQRML